MHERHVLLTGRYSSSEAPLHGRHDFRRCERGRRRTALHRRAGHVLASSANETRANEGQSAHITLHLGEQLVANVELGWLSHSLVRLTREEQSFRLVFRYCLEWSVTWLFVISVREISTRGANFSFSTKRLLANRSIVGMVVISLLSICQQTEEKSDF